MQKFIVLLSCATVLLWGGCSKDNDESGVLNSPEALEGTWQLVRTVEHYKEDGKWYTDVEYDADKTYYDDDNSYYDIYEPDGEYRQESYTRQGNLIGKRSGNWSYENGRIYIDTYDPLKVHVLTSSKLVTYDYYDDGSYDEDIYKRIK